MARPKRMGAYNALDELLPGPPVSERRLEAVPDLPPPRSRGHRPLRINALDDLMPGPGGPGDADVAAVAVASRRPRLEPVPDPEWGQGDGQRHLGAWNPLDDLPPTPSSAKTRVSVRLPSDLVEAARDAVAHLAGTADRTTLAALVERGLRAELARQSALHHDGRPFPQR